jgi:hypothetical protein
MKRILQFSALVLLVLVIEGCGGGHTPSSPTPPAAPAPSVIFTVTSSAPTSQTLYLTPGVPRFVTFIIQDTSGLQGVVAVALGNPSSWVTVSPRDNAWRVNNPKGIGFWTWYLADGTAATADGVYEETVALEARLGAPGLPPQQYGFQFIGGPTQSVVHAVDLIVAVTGFPEFSPITSSQSLAPKEPQR